MDPCNADDIAACTADILPVFVDASPGLMATYSRYGWTVFLHVDRFHPHTANHLPLEFYLL